MTLTLVWFFTETPSNLKNMPSVNYPPSLYVVKTLILFTHDVMNSKSNIYFTTFPHICVRMGSFLRFVTCLKNTDNQSSNIYIYIYKP